MLHNLTFFLSNISENASKVLLQEYKKAMFLIKISPKLYPKLLINSEKEYRKFLFYRRYMIIYYIEECNIYIDYIIDCRTNYLKYIN